MSANLNIGIAGAGLLGRMLAWRLLRQGHQVSIFDRDSIEGENSAARVAAAMLAPYSEAVTSDAEMLTWGRQSLALWPVWLDELRSDSGAEVFFQQCGSIVVAHANDTANLSHFKQRLTKILNNETVAEDAVQDLNRDSLAELEPELTSRFQQGIYLKEEGCLDNWGLLAALSQAIKHLGGVWHENVQVDALASGEIVVGQERHNFDLVIDCRGFGAKADFQGLRGVRGEVLWVKAEEVSLTRPVRLMHPRYQLYIAPKPNQLYVIGATEIESESLSPITVQSSLELQSALFSMHSGFAEAQIIKAYAQCRPALMNNLPRIVCEHQCISANGLYRHGYLLSPWFVKKLEALVVGKFHADEDNVVEYQESNQLLAGAHMS